MTKNWMKELARHYRKMRARYPDDKLLILFDLDSGILDMRHTAANVLKSFDRKHGTNVFVDTDYTEIRRPLKPGQTLDEKMKWPDGEPLLADSKIPKNQSKPIRDWYDKYKWDKNINVDFLRPHPGALDIVRWFQIQPNTFVACDTSRTKKLKRETLNALNRIGEPHQVRFSQELLLMRETTTGKGVAATRFRSIRHLQKRGYRIFAVVDSDQESLRAVSKIDPEKEILLLSFKTAPGTGLRTGFPMFFSGKTLNLVDLIDEKTLPQNIQYVWHGINNHANLKQFLGADIQWGEVDVRLDELSDQFFVRHDSLAESPIQREEETLLLKDCLSKFMKFDKSVKLDYKLDRAHVDQVLDFVEKLGFDQERLWHTGNIEDLGEEGFRKIRKRHPRAIIQCTSNFLVPLVLGAPHKAKDIVAMLRDWGVNRVSIDWRTDGNSLVLSQIKDWGMEVNLYKMPDLHAFLQAILLLPKSVTSDFNFPEWQYYGQGSGEKLKRQGYQKK